MLQRSVATVAAIAVATTGALALDAVVAPAPASALSASDFDPGYIISDANFYNGQAMSSAEIQAFLDARIGSCLNGNCLNVARVPVDDQTRRISVLTGNEICAAFSGGTLRVSELIYRVQVACGISAKVILVTLEKEQSLVTSRAPTAWALSHAMGMACPDTAPCDAAYAGLARQIITGTAQLKTYKAARFARQPGVHVISYNPNAACGASAVNVRNYATAALYNYTPYQPNAAALANIGGYGDACSSYGNRNFWAFYWNWFGSPTGGQKPYTNAAPFVVGRNSVGDLLMYTGNGRGGWAAAAVVGQGWNEMRLMTVGGDFDGDGNRDLVAIDNAGSLWLYPTNGYGEFSSRSKLADGMSSAKFLLAPGDLTGDLRDDIIVVNDAGAMTLYPTIGSGSLAAPISMAGTWTGLTSVLAVGDFDGDRLNDIMSIEPSGALWLHPGTGTGDWRPRMQIGTGWNIMDAVLGVRDFDGDGANDLLARRTNGDLWLYRGDGRAGWRNGYVVGTDWNMFTALASSGAPSGSRTATVGFGDLSSDGRSDLLAKDTTGALWIYVGAGGGNIGGRIRIDGDWSGTEIFMSMGDLNADGFRDVLTVDAAGALWRYTLRGNNLVDPVQIGGGWDAMTSISTPGDFDGDGIADILASDANGDLWLYSGPAFNTVRIGTGFGTVDWLGAGDFDGDGASDVLVTYPNGDLYNYRGNGSGLWAAQFPKIGTGWKIFDRLIAPGDFNADGKVDILARKPNGDLWLYPGDGRGGWGWYFQVGTGWQIMSWIG